MKAATISSYTQPTPGGEAKAARSRPVGRAQTTLTNELPVGDDQTWEGPLLRWGSFHIGNRCTTQVLGGGADDGPPIRSTVNLDNSRIRSPYGRNEPAIPEAADLGARLRELTEDSWIEFFEMLTPEKAMELG